MLPGTSCHVVQRTPEQMMRCWYSLNSRRQGERSGALLLRMRLVTAELRLHKCPSRCLHAASYAMPRHFAHTQAIDALLVLVELAPARRWQWWPCFARAPCDGSRKVGKVKRWCAWGAHEYQGERSKAPCNIRLCILKQIMRCRYSLSSRRRGERNGGLPLRMRPVIAQLRLHKCHSGCMGAPWHVMPCCSAHT